VANVQSTQEFQASVENLIKQGYNRDRAIQMVLGWTKNGGKNPPGAKDRAISHGADSLKKKINYNF
jgi:hypothetical protein